MRGPKPTTGDEKKKNAWVKSVRELMSSVQKWAEQERWLIEMHEKNIDEDRYGSYAVPELFIRTPQLKKFVLDPVGLDVPRSEGRVDIEVFPSLNRFVLIRRDKKWNLLTDSMVEWPEPWGKKAFLGIVDALGKAA